MPSIFRDNLLQNKVALVTGGGSGICRRIAERFAEQGAKVGLIGRTQAKLDETAAGIRAAGGEAAGFAADVRDYAALERAIEQTRARYGEIDILLCGAAGNFPASALGMSAKGFKAVIDIDLLGTFNTCRAAHQHLHKPGASVIAISATHAFRPIAWQAHVCAAKAGIDILIKTLALEWGPDVRLNIVTPGPVADTEGVRRLSPTEESTRRLTSAIPLRRFATKDEIADLTLFLCSDSATYITGGVFVCDGGSSLAGAGLLLGPRNE